MVVVVVVVTKEFGKVDNEGEKNDFLTKMCGVVILWLFKLIPVFKQKLDFKRNGKDEGWEKRVAV